MKHSILILAVIITIYSCNKKKDVKPVSPIKWDEWVYEGDSITDTVGGFLYDWPTQLPLLSSNISIAKQVNVATTADYISNMIVEYATQVHPVRPQLSNQNYCFAIMAGLNDCRLAGSSQQIYNNLKTEWGYARADGFKVMAFCITRVGEHIGDSVVQKVNTLIISNSKLYDYLIRTDLLLPDPTNTLYFRTDQIHPNATGSKMIAQEVVNVLNTN